MTKPKNQQQAKPWQRPFFTLENQPGVRSSRLASDIAAHVNETVFRRLGPTGAGFIEQKADALARSIAAELGKQIMEGLKTFEEAIDLAGDALDYFNRTSDSLCARGFYAKSLPGEITKTKAALAAAGKTTTPTHGKTKAKAKAPAAKAAPAKKKTPPKKKATHTPIQKSTAPKKGRRELVETPARSDIEYDDADGPFTASDSNGSAEHAAH